MKTRPAPGDSDTPDTLPGEAGSKALTDDRVLEDGDRPDEPVSEDLKALFPESSSSTSTTAVPVTATRRSARSTFGDFMRNLSLDDRLGRVALSIVLAVLLWFYVTSLENPARITEFNDIPLEPRNVGQNLKIINTLPIIDVTIQAPQNVMSTLRPADVHPFVDLQRLDTGVHQVPVMLEVNGAAGRSIISWSVDPEDVQVQLEAQASRVMTVAVRTIGAPAFGYSIEQPQVDPSEVTVTGPEDAVANVEQVVVEVNINGEATTKQGLISPFALDASGQQIQGLTFEPEAVQVVVPIQLLVSYKLAAVRPNVVGNPAPGYSVVAIIPEPRSVTICCAPVEVLDPIESLDTQPIGITNTTSTVITTTQLIIPEGVELYPGQSSTVTVTIRLETFETSFTLAVVPSVEGEAPGTSAVVSPSSIDVRLTGTLAHFQSLRPEDVRAVLDLGGRGPGTYQIEPQITVPQGIRVEDVQPAQMTVSVLAPTAVPPTQTSTPAPSPTSAPEPTVTTGAAVAASPSPVDTPQPEPTASPTQQTGQSSEPALSPVPTTGVILDQTE